MSAIALALMILAEIEQAEGILDQLLKVCCDRAATNLQHSKRTVLRLADMPHAKYVLVDRFQSSHKGIWLRHLKIWRQCLAVAETGGEKREN